jgi:glc operon protein GlcG
MFSLLFVLLSFSGVAPSNDLPTKKYLDLAAVKTMVAAAEAEAKKRNVDVTICIVDDSGNLLFLQKSDTAPINTTEEGAARRDVQEPFQRRGGCGEKRQC